MISILLADSHEIVREALAALLARIPEFKVCGQCANAYQLFKSIEILNPDVVLIDESMSGLSIGEAARSIRRISPATRVIALMFYRESLNFAAEDSEICGFISKTSTRKDLIHAVKFCSHGKMFWNELPLSEKNRLRAAVLKNYSNFENRALTRREREVLRLIGEGNSSKEIARRLGISHTTVKTHRNHLMDKLEVKNVAGLTRESIRLKLVPLE